MESTSVVPAASAVGRRRSGDEQELADGLLRFEIAVRGGGGDNVHPHAGGVLNAHSSLARNVIHADRLETVLRDSAAYEHVVAFNRTL